MPLQSLFGAPVSPTSVPAVRIAAPGGASVAGAGTSNRFAGALNARRIRRHRWPGHFLLGLCALTAFWAPVLAVSADISAPSQRVLHQQLALRIENALKADTDDELRFEVVDVADWRLGPTTAEFVLWGLLQRQGRIVEMLRIESGLDRRTLELVDVRMERFDELQVMHEPDFP